MWICPDCSRTFKNTNQDHSCKKFDPELHFIHKEAHVKAIFQTLTELVLGFGEVQIHSLKHAILFTAKSNFLAVKPKKKWIDVEFLLKEEVNEFPIHKTVRVTKTKWAHFARIGSIQEIDEEMTGWWRRAYEASK